jgi:hypothetical protein
MCIIVLISVADPDPGSGAFLIPGSGMGRKSASGSGMKNPDHIFKSLETSVADPGCLSRIPDPTFFHPGSRIRTVSIPDPGSSKNLCILTPKKAKTIGF